MHHSLILCLLCLPPVFSGCPYTARSGLNPPPVATTHGQRVPPSWMGQLPGATNMSDPLVRMNTEFKRLYDVSGVRVQPDPVIMAEGDYLVLFLNGSRTAVKPQMNMTYHNLKMIAHIPLALFDILLPSLKGTSGDVALSPDVLEDLKRYYSIASAADIVTAIQDGRFTPGAQLERQLHMHSVCMHMMGTVVSTGTASLDAISSFVHSLLPLISLNLDEAAEVQVLTIVDALNEWKEMVGEKTWRERLWLVAGPSHMARKENLVSQVFARVFDVDILQSDRFITLTSHHEEAGAFTLLNTHVLDYAAGYAFFDDQYRLHEDALCGGASKALNKLFPNTINQTGCVYP